MNKQKYLSKVLTVSATFFLFNLSLLYGDDVQKEAFDMGMKSAIKVMQHERSQAFKPIPKGYCIEVKTVDNQETDYFSAIKLESLALFMNFSPSLLETVNAQNQKENILCFTMTEKTRKHAESILEKIKKEYPKINNYYPSIIQISHPQTYTRVVPGVGELFEDKSKTISDLISTMEQEKRRYEKQISAKSKTINELKEKIRKVGMLLGDGLKGEISLNPSQTDPSVAKKKNNTDNEDDATEEEAQKTKGGVAKQVFKPTIGVETSTNVTTHSTHPIIFAKENNVRYADNKKGHSVQFVDKDNPRLLKIERH
ncbi:MAG TPA: hypothetical protein ENN12_03505 [Epsilonproteobacteria bacterium]|nr:hypothetical protein [Campylobacterota bacterium]